MEKFQTLLRDTHRIASYLNLLLKTKPKIIISRHVAVKSVVFV
jgi:hypothetical protein